MLLNCGVVDLMLLLREGKREKGGRTGEREKEGRMEGEREGRKDLVLLTNG